MKRTLAFRCSLFTLVLFVPSARAQETPAGQRVFYTGHSFHMFVPPRVDQVAASAGIKDHKTVGTQSIGGSRVIQHWDLKNGDNKAREVLKDGKIDVFTMSPHLAVPDSGIDNFVELGLKANPKLRFLVQASWVPFDLTLPDLKISPNLKRDETSLAKLQEGTDLWRAKVEAQADDLNKKHGAKAVFVIPVGDAVNELRRKVKAGEFPGVKTQAELFRDPIGHGLGHVQALAAYCNFVAIYRTSPVGLKLKEQGVTPEQHEILQRIAWDTVSKYERAGIK